MQLAVHALPTFMVSTLMPSGASSQETLLYTLLYYIMMAGYGHQWRLVAFNATTTKDHVALLILFQIFDVFFRYVHFCGRRLSL